ncbi:hypothetical protein PCC7424_5051 [Gloeothece citriformis PCC 7424]|uniref:Uncharacterized protein n=1 Tax=Gloeothece citriformis (strain PCC 7424) TaxID=65393 RepID=B7KFS8_GLOC7|nr:hypothetical protein [Gloeothece citriformis]ACK73403.1 hypothetical protein PCC7424_5051 [Gloeothece citriformis PCC 7424]
MNKANTELNQDLDMLDEYDFTGGVRGKYYQQYQNGNIKPLKGIQFVTDTKGRKTGVLIDLNEYQYLWDECLKTFDESVKVQYLVDSQGEKIAVCLSFREHLQIWQKIYDTLIA